MLDDVTMTLRVSEEVSDVVGSLVACMIFFVAIYLVFLPFEET